MIKVWQIDVRATQINSLLAAILLSYTSPCLATPIQAGFDCSKAASLTEKAICKSWDTSFADRVQSVTYKTLMDKTEKSKQALLRKEQLAWLKKRDQNYRVIHKLYSKSSKNPWLMTGPLLRSINKRTASLISKLAELTSAKKLSTKISLDHQRLFGTWKIIAVINDGQHDSGYPAYAETFLNKVVKLEESQCPAKDRVVDEVDIFEWYGHGYRSSAEDFGFKNYSKVMHIACSVSVIYPYLTNAEYFFYNDYLISDGMNILIRLDQPASNPE